MFLGQLLSAMFEYFKAKKAFLISGAAAGATPVIIMLANASYTDRQIQEHQKSSDEWRRSHLERGDIIKNGIHDRLDRLERNFDNKAITDYENLNSIYQAITDDPEAKLRKPKIEK